MAAFTTYPINQPPKRKKLKLKKSGGRAVCSKKVPGIAPALTEEDLKALQKRGFKRSVIGGKSPYHRFVSHALWRSYR